MNKFGFAVSGVLGFAVWVHGCEGLSAQDVPAASGVPAPNVQQGGNANVQEPVIIIVK